MAAAWGARPLDTIAATDIEAMQQQMAATARSRRNSRSGRHAGEHVIAAARAIYNRAIADGLIGPPLTSRRYDHLWKRSARRCPGSPCTASLPTGCATPP